MVFSSLTFLFVFLPLVLIVYFIVPQKFKNFVLFVFSLIFYAWGEPIYVSLMIFSTVLDYTCGRAVERYRGTGKAKAALLVSVIVNLSLLCFFKYTDFLTGIINSVFGTAIPPLDLPLPIGISFYTFQTMSYTIDVYRGDVKAQKNIVSFGTYVALFPQLIAGPIVRYSTIAKQIDSRTHSADKITCGLRRFVVGLFKKVIIANNIGLLWNNIQSATSSGLTVLLSLMGILAFAFQIYFDFSGYSDMAIGLGKILGFDFDENFNYPYCSKSITEFWRRWHISMGTWFRDYVYIPLGGSRKGIGKTLKNLFIVWFLTGLWHGASLNYILWGLFYGIVLIAEKLFILKILKKLPNFIGHLYSVTLILFGWILFAFEDLGKCGEFLKSLFGKNALYDNNSVYVFFSYLPLLIICAILSTPAIKTCIHKLQKKLKPAVYEITETVSLAFLFFLSVTYLIGGSYNPFLYFRF